MFSFCHNFVDGGNEAKCQKNILNISGTERKLHKCFPPPLFVCFYVCSGDLIHKKEKQDEKDGNLSL
jgi:hypothetical protein